jgi:adenylylsulfate kinase
MVILFFGQPTSGKTTLADAFMSKMCKIDKFYYCIRIDGDEWRETTKNKDYSREGRIANQKSAFAAAKLLDNKGLNVVLSFVSPYKEVRDYLQEHTKVKMIYLNHFHLLENRGRNMYFVDDFEKPSGEYLQLNTSVLNLDECVDKCIQYCYPLIIR